MRYLIFIFIAFLYSIIIAGVCFLILPFYGEYWGLVLAIVSILLVFITGEKFVLAKLQSKVLSRESFIYSVFKNFAYQQKLPNGKFYTSSYLRNNIVVMKSFFSNSFSVVIGEQVEDLLSERELKSLVFGILEEVDNGSAKINLAFVELLYLCYFPIIVFQKVVSDGLRFFYVPLAYFYFPLRGIESVFFKKRKCIEKESLFESLTNLSHIDFETALMKLRERSTFKAQVGLSYKLIYNLSIATNRFDSFLDIIFFRGARAND